MTRRSPEHDLQVAVVAHLRARRRSGVWFCAIPNEGKRSPVTAARMKARGLTPGAGDLILVIDGQAFALELKHGRNKLTLAQVAQREAFRAAGGIWAEAYSLDEALFLLTRWKAIRPDASARRAA